MWQRPILLELVGLLDKDVNMHHINLEYCQLIIWSEIENQYIMHRLLLSVEK